MGEIPSIEKILEIVSRNNWWSILTMFKYDIEQWAWLYDSILNELWFYNISLDVVWNDDQYIMASIDIEYPYFLIYNSDVETFSWDTVSFLDVAGEILHIIEWAIKAKEFLISYKPL